MRIQSIKIRNFRLLCDVELELHNRATVIVGRNNSGKTSLAEVVRRFLAGSNPAFGIEDFSSACYDKFCEARAAKIDGADDGQVRRLLPSIGLRIHFDYDPDAPNLGPLSDFIVDLDDHCHAAVAEIEYALEDGKIDALFEGETAVELDEAGRGFFFRSLKDRIPKLFGTKLWAEDPNDPSNRKPLPMGALRSALHGEFINAHRGLTDVTSKDNDVLAVLLEKLFTTAMAPTSATDDRARAEALQAAVQEIQARIDGDFKDKLDTLLPTLESFGYPGLSGPALRTETVLDVKRLLSNHTKVRYAGYSGVPLPESYNGLGARNLIFILLELVRFYKSYRAEPQAPGVHLVFVEEPEAHLHPQMQEVFIRQLSEIATALSQQDSELPPWPVQFVVSTHSSHIANAAGFESIRYFLASSGDRTEGVRCSEVKDLSTGLGGTPEDREFLHQYLTLTRCDLFFADKAILVEGLSERLMLPPMIREIERAEPSGPKLSSQYVTTMEVGGAYAHLFFGLLDFLEIKHVVITDLDPTKDNGDGKYVACLAHEGDRTSNACLKQWFGGQPSPADLLGQPVEARIDGLRRLAYQCPEADGGPCGRTFEDAFVLANRALFGMPDAPPEDLEVAAREEASRHKKAAFALHHAITATGWNVPRYIAEAIRWLAEDRPLEVDPKLAMVAEAAAGAGAEPALEAAQ